MLTALIMAASGVVAYGPPSNRDVYDAYTARIVETLREAGDVLKEDSVRRHVEFPSDVFIERCRKKAEHKVFDSLMSARVMSGYECIFEVWPNADIPFRTVGFLNFDGFDWVYHGAARAPDVPSASEFGRSDGLGEFEVKPGSMEYEGDPKNPLNPDYNPYQEHFDAVFGPRRF